MASRSAVRLALVLVLAPLGFASGIRNVDQPGLGTFTSLQAAIDAASEGDLLLVAKGNYLTATIDGKSLSIVAMPGANDKDTRGIVVKNLAAHQRVLLSGLDIVGVGTAGVLLQDNQGHVRVHGCTIVGGLSGSYPTVTSHPGVRISSCPGAVLADCWIRGASGGQPSGEPPIPGGHGLEATSSSIGLFDCEVTGGTGSEETAPSGGNGGNGLHITGWGAFLSGTKLNGGRGGGGDYIGCNAGGLGGDALDLTSNQVLLLDSVLTPGGGGWSSCGPFSPPGVAVDNHGGIVTTLPGSARVLEGPRLASDEAPLVVTITGEPGDRVWLFSSYTPSQQFLPGLGIWTVTRPTFVPMAPLGTVPASGTLRASVPVHALPFGAPQGVLYAQALVYDVAGKAFLSSPLHVGVVDASGGPDCNASQINDFVELFALGAPDCNHNLEIDACDIASGVAKDCNANAVPDSCDIASGLEKDCNANQIPDSCDFASGVAKDCNGNGKPDSCDIASGFSLDVNHNGIPDECEPIAPVTWWVDDDAAFGGNGSQAQPFKSIGQGIAAAFHGDTVMIKNGLYRGAGNKNLTLNGREIVIRSESGAAGCVIDCENSGQAFYVHNGEGPALRFQGLTIRNGNSKSGGLYAEGGAIAILSSSPQIVGCVIENCQAWRHGGGIFAYDTSVQIRNTLIRNCSALSGPSYGPGKGGAIYLWVSSGSQSALVNCGIQDCTSNDGGGLLVGGGSDVLISHCRIVGNAGTDGGGVHADPSGGFRIALDNCVLAGNTAQRGGAVQFTSDSPSALTGLLMTDCTFVQNAATLEGGTLRVSGNSTAAPLELYDSILWNSSAPLGSMVHVNTAGTVTVAWCDVQGGTSGFALGAGTSLSYGPGNLDSNPLFVDIDGADNNLLTVGDNDYRLAPGSPCIDAGDNALVALDLVDIDGDGNLTEPTPFDLLHQPRFVEDPLAPNTGLGTPPLVDMGAFERQP
jgi:hypothetical protein